MAVQRVFGASNTLRGGDAFRDRTVSLVRSKVSSNTHRRFLNVWRCIATAVVTSGMRSGTSYRKNKLYVSVASTNPVKMAYFQFFSPTMK